MRDDLTKLHGDPNASSLAGLVFELASQLHVERTRRMALETALTRADILRGQDIAGLAEDREFLATARGALDHSIDRLMRIMLESPDERMPLRSEALLQNDKD